MYKERNVAELTSLVDQLCWETDSLALLSLFLSLSGSRLFPVSHGISKQPPDSAWTWSSTQNQHWAPGKGISEAQSSNKLGWHLLPISSTTLANCCTTASGLWWNSVVRTHLFIISSCFSLASSYLSAKRSAISRKLFLYASEKCLFILDLHARRSAWGNRPRSLEKQAGAGGEPTCLIVARNAFACFTQDPASSTFCTKVRHSWCLTW